MVFKLIEAASERWRYVNGPHLVALVRAGATFERECSSSGRMTPG
jgi:putative transposase